MNVNLAAFVIVKFLILFMVFGNAEGVYYMKNSQTIAHDPRVFADASSEHLQVYCYNGKSKSILHFFETVKLAIIIDEDKKYTQYEGENPEEVLEHYEANKSLFNINLFSKNRPRLSLPPFENYCLGIATDEAYKINLKVIPFDHWRLSQFLLGVLFFFKAHRLSNNSIFFYASGVLFGIFASSLLALYIAAKFVPKPPMMYGLLIGGWTLTAYLVKFVLENVQLLYNSYSYYIIWYILIVGIASFLYFYRMGPLTNPRSKKIMKWILEFLSLIVIYFSTHYDIAAIYVCFSMLLMRYFPYSIYAKLYKMYRIRYPLPRRLLTMKEYEKQGVEETNKSLVALREFVNSPNCSQWRVISTLRNPSSFAEFANGGHHISYDELNRFEHMIVDSSDEYDDTDNNAVDDDVENNDWNNHYSSHDFMNEYVDYEDSDDSTGER